MTVKRYKPTAGFTLVEVMLAILILSVAVIGASGYRYYAALDARKATMQVTAARTALLLCESWHGVKGTETYDPITSFGSDLAIEGIYVDFEVLPDWTILGLYRIAVNGLDYHAVLLWKDIYPGLRALSVIVAWDQRDSPFGFPNKSFKLTTYALN